MRIACVERDSGQALMIQKALYVPEERECAIFRCPTELGVALRDQEFDLILLCLYGDGPSGEALIVWLRNIVGSRLPIMVVLSRPDESLMVELLLAGADGCLSKPYYQRELAARVTALLRRVNAASEVDNGLLTVGSYVVDEYKKTVTLNSKVITLSRRQFLIALHLFRHSDCVVTRECLERLVWGHSLNANSRALDTQLSRVRAKLELYPHNGVQLTSIYARGFRLAILAK